RAQDDLAQLRVGHVVAAERGLPQLVAVDRAVAVLDQVAQAFEHARLQRHERVVAAQFALGDGELEGLEAGQDAGHEWRTFGPARPTSRCGGDSPLPRLSCMRGPGAMSWWSGVRFPPSPGLKACCSRVTGLGG